MNPPSDGDDVAKVTPLRRRDPRLVAVPPVRDPLPAESSVWDTGDPGEPPLRRSRRRQLSGVLTIGWGSVRSLLTIRRLSLVSAGLVLGCVAVTAIALSTGSGPVTRPHRTGASSLEPHGSLSAKVSIQAAHPAQHPARHQARHRVRHVIRRTSVDAPRATPRRSSAHTSNATQAAPPTPTTTAPAVPSTPVSPSAGAPSTVVSSSNTSQSSRATGPTGSGAAFGPGY